MNVVILYIILCDCIRRQFDFHGQQFLLCERYYLMAFANYFGLDYSNTKLQLHDSGKEHNAVHSNLQCGGEWQKSNQRNVHDTEKHASIKSPIICSSGKMFVCLKKRRNE